VCKVVESGHVIGKMIWFGED